MECDLLHPSRNPRHTMAKAISMKGLRRLSIRGELIYFAWGSFLVQNVENFWCMPYNTRLISRCILAFNVNGHCLPTSVSSIEYVNKRLHKNYFGHLLLLCQS